MELPDPVCAAITFGPFVLRLDHQRLWHAGREILLKPREMRLLVYLARRRPRVIARDEMLEALWPDDTADSALTQALYRLRRELHACSPNHEYIRTVPGVGLQFAGASPLDRWERRHLFEKPFFRTYQRALFLYRSRSEGDLLEALRLLEAITTVDTDCVEALVTLAEVCTTAAIRSIVDPGFAHDRAANALHSARALDPGNSEVFAAISRFRLFFEADADGAQCEAEQALILAPQSPAARTSATWTCLAMKDFDGALFHADLNVAHHTESCHAACLLGIVLYMHLHYAQAHHCFETVLSVYPSYAAAIYYDACTLCAQGDYGGAIRRLDSMSPTDMPGRVLALRGYITAMQGGDTGAAAGALMNAFAERDAGTFLTSIDPLFTRATAV